jgi:hypothetical protein
MCKYSKGAVAACGDVKVFGIEDQVIIQSKEE